MQLVFCWLTRSKRHCESFWNRDHCIECLWSLRMLYSLISAKRSDWLKTTTTSLLSAIALISIFSRGSNEQRRCSDVSEGDSGGKTNSFQDSWSATSEESSVWFKITRGRDWDMVSSFNAWSKTTFDQYTTESFSNRFVPRKRSERRSLLSMNVLKKSNESFDFLEVSFVFKRWSPPMPHGRDQINVSVQHRHSADPFFTDISVERKVSVRRAFLFLWVSNSECPHLSSSLLSLSLPSLLWNGTSVVSLSTEMSSKGWKTNEWQILRHVDLPWGVWSVARERTVQT